MELLERAYFLEKLNSLANECAQGTGHVVLVSGEAGIGKTSLVQHFTERVTDARVLWGACDALFTPRPLGPLHDIARDLGGKLRDLLASESNRSFIFSACFDELGRTGTSTILVFEDVHWADEATLDLIKYLGRRIARLPALLVLTFRDDEVSTQHPLRSVIGDLPRQSVARVVLPHLSQSAVAAMASQAGRAIDNLYELSGGNPFFVTELLSTRVDVPPTVRDAVLSRAARLSPSAREIVELVSLVPPKMENTLLEKILHPQAASISQILNLGMLRWDKSTVSFRHELARRAVEDSLPVPRRQELHRRVLDELLSQDRTTETVARIVHHATNANRTDEILQFAPLAAQQAATVGAHREAASHYATALQYGRLLPDDERALLLEHFSYECYLTSNLDRAIESRQEALAIWRNLRHQEKQGHNLRWISRISWFQGVKADAERYAAEALNVLDGLPPSTEVAMAYSNRAQLHMLAEETDAAVEWGNRAIHMAAELNDQETLAHALNNVGVVELMTGAGPDGEKLKRSLEISLQQEYQEHAARAYTNLAGEYVARRNYHDGMRYLNDGIAYCQERDLDSWTLYMTSWRARALFEAGQWNEAVQDANYVLSKTQVPAVSKISALVVLARVRTRRGDPDAEVLLDQARDLAMPTGELQRIAPVAAGRAEAAWLQGNTQRCVREARVGFELAIHRADNWDLGELAFWMWKGGGLSSPPETCAEPFVAQIHGKWEHAARLWHGIGCPYEEALALAQGDSQSQRDALAIFERLGAGPMAAIVRQELRAKGVRGLPRGPRSTTKQNPGGLTSREMEIVALLDEGLQNTEIAARLFISPKTVDHHVSAILSKLHVRSRMDAATAARNMGILVK